MNRRLYAAVAVAVAVMPLLDVASTVARPVTVPTGTATSTADTLRALDVLHRYGYTINTAARAGRAIRHWQRINGLTVDGIVGPQTLDSLHLPATVTQPAVRLNPPAPPTSFGAPGDPEQAIRAAWPDNLEDHAVAIAMRESRLQPGVRTWCCFGLMQIHKQHLSWLCPQLGICTTDQLYDPTLNAQAAYALYQRDGWTPWSR